MTLNLCYQGKHVKEAFWALNEGVGFFSKIQKSKKRKACD